MSVEATAPSSPTGLPHVARGDFPTWLPAMFVKEVRQGLRTKGFVGAFIGFQVLLAVIMAGAASDSSTSSGRAGAFEIVNGIFWALLAVQLLLFTPGRALGGLQMEVTSRTVDLLMLTRLNAWRIVTAKWGSLVAQSVLVLVAMLPYGIVRYYLGQVDLVTDAERIVALLAGSALLTAAGLWGAGLGKVFRFAVIVVLVLGSGIGPSFLTMLTRSAGIPTFGAFYNKASLFMLWYDGALILLFCLVAAVRNIAPPAENHSLLARSLPLLGLAPVFVLGATSGYDLLRSQQILFSGIFLMVVCMAELGNRAQPMAVHLRALRRLTAVSRVLLHMTLPGWPSAMLYTFLATMLWTACAVVLTWNSAGNNSSFVVSSFSWPWISVLGLASVLFPAWVISMLKRTPRQPMGLYFVMFGAAGTLLPVAYAVATVSPKLVFLKPLVSVLPVSSFILAVGQAPDLAYLMGPQALVALVVIGGACWRSQAYWRRLDTLRRATLK